MLSAGQALVRDCRKASYPSSCRLRHLDPLPVISTGVEKFLHSGPTRNLMKRYKKGTPTVQDDEQGKTEPLPNDERTIVRTSFNEVTV